MPSDTGKRRGSFTADNATADSESTTSKNLPNGKDFHFFLSHKKQHSTYGGVPAEIARNLHDSLELLDYTGWLDVDRLTKITQEELKAAISKCATMVVVLHDETHQSEWCTYEWAVAAELGIPVKVVCDMERCNKQTALGVIGASHPHLLQYQWVELVSSTRRQCLTEVAAFLEEVSLAAAAPDDDDDGGLRLGSGRPIMHEAMEGLLVFGGVPCRTPRWRVSRAWCSFVFYGRALCLAACSARLTYASGPMFTDVQSSLTIVLWHAFVFYCPFVLNKLLRSDEMLKMLTYLDGGTCEEQGERLYEHTKIAGVALSIFTVVASAGFSLCTPVYLHRDYIGPEAAWYDHAYGWSGFVIVTFLIPPILASFCASFALMYLMLCLGSMTLEAAFDKLHPKLAELGLHRFVSIARVTKLQLSHASIAKFHVAWNIGLEHYCTVQRALAVPQALGLFIAAVALAEPYHLLTMGFFYDSSVPWNHVVRHLLVWLGVGVLTVVGILFSGVYCTEAMKRLLWASLQLVPDNPQHGHAVRQVIDAVPLTCTVAYALPATRWTVLVSVATCAASGAPFLYLDFYGMTPAHLLAGLLARLQAASGDTSLLRLGAVVALSLGIFATHFVLRVAKECREGRRANQLAGQSEFMV